MSQAQDAFNAAMTNLQSTVAQLQQHAAALQAALDADNDQDLSDATSKINDLVTHLSSTVAPQVQQAGTATSTATVMAQPNVTTQGSATGQAGPGTPTTPVPGTSPQSSPTNPTAAQTAPTGTAPASPAPTSTDSSASTDASTNPSPGAPPVPPASGP